MNQKLFQLWIEWNWLYNLLAVLSRLIWNRSSELMGKEIFLKFFRSLKCVSQVLHYSYQFFKGRIQYLFIELRIIWNCLSCFKATFGDFGNIWKGLSVLLPVEIEVTLAGEGHRTEITPVDHFWFTDVDDSFTRIDQLLVDAQMQPQIRHLFKIAIIESISQYQFTSFISSNG